MRGVRVHRAWQSGWRGGSGRGAVSAGGSRSGRCVRRRVRCGWIGRRRLRDDRFIAHFFRGGRRDGLDLPRARLLVPETRATAFMAGAPVQITGSTGESATARILVVSPTVDPGSGTREVIVELSEPNGFRPGAAVLIEPSEEEAKER